MIAKVVRVKGGMKRLAVLAGVTWQPQVLLRVRILYFCPSGHEIETYMYQLEYIIVYD